MEKLKAFWTKVVAVFDYVASYVAAYPKTALGLIIALAFVALT
jgi:hypothetical protein